MANPPEDESRNEKLKVEDFGTACSSDSTTGSFCKIQRSLAESFGLPSHLPFEPQQHSNQSRKRTNRNEAQQTGYSIRGNHTKFLRQQSLEWIQSQICLLHKSLHILSDQGSGDQGRRESLAGATSVKSLHSDSFISGVHANETSIPVRLTSLHGIKLSSDRRISSNIPKSLKDSSLSTSLKRSGNMLTSKKFSFVPRNNFYSPSSTPMVSTNGSCEREVHPQPTGSNESQSGKVSCKLPTTPTQNATGDFLLNDKVLVNGKTNQKTCKRASCLSMPLSQSGLLNTYVSTSAQQRFKTIKAESVRNVQDDSGIPNHVQQSPNTQKVLKLDLPSTNNTVQSLLPSSTSVMSTDAKNIRQQQQQLVLLLHADECGSKGEVTRCAVPGCRATKDLLDHSRNCTSRRDCPPCSSSYELLFHCSNCIKDDCPLCSVVRSTLNTLQQQYPPETQSNLLGTPSYLDSECLSKDISNNDEYCNADKTLQNVVVPRFNSFRAGQPKELVLSVDKLWKALTPVLKKMPSSLKSLHLKRQSDPELLQMPGTNIKNESVVENAVDIDTIKRKVDSRQYQDPWQLIDDMWLMFNYVWRHNRRSSHTFKHYQKLAQVFEKKINPIMKSLGYCCGRKYFFHPQVLLCYGKDFCTVQSGERYWSYQNKNVQNYGNLDRYIYCQKCFSAISGDTVTIVDDTPVVIEKEKFVEMLNQVEMERFVSCGDCGKKFHQICVLYLSDVCPEGFTCFKCLMIKGLKKKDHKFDAEKLPQTVLGRYIEKRVKAFLRKKSCSAGEVTIRAISCIDKLFEVKPALKKKYLDGGEWPQSFPYRAKALFAFQKIDGVDVCIFGMHVQEYGSQCPLPNARRVYIAYLDSVHFFRPRDLRTDVYHEIVLGYLKYAKQMGYTTAHVWSVPPSPGDDYIFYCHPPEQKIPTRKRLQDWYKAMLLKGINEKIILDYKDILTQAIEENLTSPSQLPYFEGDFWPDFLEKTIKKLTTEEGKNRDAASQGSEEKIGASKRSRTKKKQKINPNKKRPKYSCKGDDVMGKMYSAMEQHREAFFVIRLRPVQDAFNLPEINDPDPVINCEVMDGRAPFLSLAREKYYEFSSLRRAKYSTMVLLYELHKDKDSFIYVCNNCQTNVEASFHCTVCDNFDLCVRCFGKVSHRHKMEKLEFDECRRKKKTDPRETRRRFIQNHFRVFVHSSQCGDKRCDSLGCEEMKRLLKHTKSCELNIKGGCPKCRKLVLLFIYHAKDCRDHKCLVWGCLKIKNMLRKQ